MNFRERNEKTLLKIVLEHVLNKIKQSNFIRSFVTNKEAGNDLPGISHAGLLENKFAIFLYF